MVKIDKELTASQLALLILFLNNLHINFSLNYIF